MATQNIYPSFDGNLMRTGQATWTLARDSDAALSVNTTTNSSVFKNSFSTTYLVSRLFMSIPIPVGIVIDSASLFIATSGSLGTFTEEARVRSATHTDALALSDYKAYGSTELATPANIAMTSVVPLNKIELVMNSAGIAYLNSNIGRTAKFAILGKHDADNIAPDASYGASVGTIENPVSDNKPYLSITYHNAAVESSTSSYGVLELMGVFD